MSSGGGGGSSGAQEKYIENQFQYDRQMYDYQWGRRGDTLTGVDVDGQQWKKYNMATKALETKKANDAIQKKFQEDTAKQAWEHSVSIQDFSHLQQLKAYQKSTEQFTQQKELNQQEYENALARESAVLDEQFIQSAFENQGLIMDLYETAGGKGYDKAAVQLGLANTQGELAYKDVQQRTGLSQTIDKAEFETASTQISLLDSAGRAKHGAGEIKAAGQLKAANLQFEKAISGEGGADVREAKQRSDFENDLIAREVRASRAKASYDSTERNIEALQALGQAQLGQAGRSQGKAVQMVLAELGRGQAYTVESLMHESNSAQARMKQNRAKALNTVQRAAIADEKIDFEALANLDKTTRDTEEIVRGLDIDIEKGELGLNQIRQSVEHAVTNTDLSTMEIDRNLRQKQAEAGFSLDKIDWDLENVGDRFKQNQLILQTTLDSAVKASIANTKDIAQAKAASDLQNWANLMIEPEKVPTPPVPLTLPDVIYDDIMAPEKPPKPIKGASFNASAGGDFMMSALSGVSAGASVYAALGSSSLATPLGLMVGLGTMFL